MPTTRETNTMSEGLNRVLQEITKMKQMPDSDLDFLVNLETGILGYLRSPTPQPGAGAQPMGGGGGMPGDMGGGMGGMGMPGMSTPTGGSMGMGAPPPGLPPGVPAAGGGAAVPLINPDELRRMLATQGR